MAAVGDVSLVKAAEDEVQRVATIIFEERTERMINALRGYLGCVGRTLLVSDIRYMCTPATPMVAPLDGQPAPVIVQGTVRPSMDALGGWLEIAAALRSHSSDIQDGRSTAIQMMELYRLLILEPLTPVLVGGGSGGGVEKGDKSAGVGGEVHKKLQHGDIVKYMDSFHNMYHFHLDLQMLPGLAVLRALGQSLLDREGAYPAEGTNISFDRMSDAYSATVRGQKVLSSIGLALVDEDAEGKPVDLGHVVAIVDGFMRKLHAILLFVHATTMVGADGISRAVLTYGTVRRYESMLRRAPANSQGVLR